MYAAPSEGSDYCLEYSLSVSISDHTGSLDHCHIGNELCESLLNMKVLVIYNISTYTNFPYYVHQLMALHHYDPNAYVKHTHCCHHKCGLFCN